MHLSAHDLKQMDEEWLQRLPPEMLLAVSKRLLADVKHLQDRLNQNPSNSSRPPSSRAPWDKTPASAQNQDASSPPDQPAAEPAAPTAPDTAAEGGTPAPAPPAASDPHKGAAAAPRRPGRQPGSPGHGRTQKLAVTDTCLHRPSHCSACGSALAPERVGVSYTAWDEIEVAPRTQTETRLGLNLSVTRHHLLEVRCDCGHLSRAQPWRASEDTLWENVTPGQWRLVGAQLAGLIVMLSLRMRLSRQRIQELLHSLFGLELSVGLIDQTIRETARLSEPLEDALVTDLHQAAQLHVDETPWPQAGVTLWLWALVSAHTVLYLVGARSREMLDNALDATFAGVLMSDGYAVYRNRPNRLRCWAHLLRKVRGVAESTDQRAARAGLKLEEGLKRLMEAVYAARATAPPVPLMQHHAADIAALKQLCERHRDDPHTALGSLARELLNDWDVILRPLEQPHFPLTNNEAERALRHWVIARRISHGTRTDAGSRAFALLASLVETCRRRGACAWRYLGRVIAAARQARELPGLPVGAQGV